jgi:23S rRNA (uridine2552-2'-O)-methyltransferase
MTDKKKPKATKGLTVKVRTAKGRRLSSTKWLERQLNDPYVISAKKEGYRSRAAYKLIEINEKFKIFKKGQAVVDLGAAPGGWTQIALDKTKPDGRVIGIDLLKVEPIPGAIILQQDFLTDEAEATIKELANGKVDVVLSDMAANSCGHPQTDHIRIMALCEAAFYFAVSMLKENGSFVAKILRGGTETSLLNEIKRYFKAVKHFKPDSSRANSSEMYVIATGFRPDDK